MRLVVANHWDEVRGVSGVPELFLVRFHQIVQQAILIFEELLENFRIAGKLIK
jgi:hypothetical protein